MLTIGIKSRNIHHPGFPAISIIVTVLWIGIRASQPCLFAFSKIIHNPTIDNIYAAGSRRNKKSEVILFVLF